MELFPLTPNLDALVGRKVSVALMKSAGGLQGLAVLTGMKIRLLGMAEKKAEAAVLLRQHTTREGSSSEGTPSASEALVKEAEKVLGGYILDAPILNDLFDGCVAEAVTSEPFVVRKAVDVLGNKCSLAAKADLSGTKKDGAYGASLVEDVKAAVDVAKDKCKVDAGHVKALDAVTTREDARKQRGGKQARAHDKRERAAQEEGLDVVSLVLNEYLSKMTEEYSGLSRREKEERLLQRSDVRNAISARQEKMRKDKEKKDALVAQQNDLKGGGVVSSADALLFSRSSGYLSGAFGMCAVDYKKESEIYFRIHTLFKQ